MGKAFITFNTPKESETLLEKFNVPWIYKIFFCSKRIKKLTLKGKVIRAERATGANDYYWRNFHVTFFSRLRRIIFFKLCALFSVICITFGL